MTKKKGVRDNYVLDPTTSEAEVNPALRYHLKELYNLTLPEVVDLRETSLDDFFGALKVQIEASEPGVTLNKIDRPQIELIRERALQRLDQYRKRIKASIKAARRSAKPDYSYDRDSFRPLGLQLFLEKVRPAPMPLRSVAGAAPEARLPQMVDSEPGPEARLPQMVDSEPGAEDGKVLAVERARCSRLSDGNNQNPYSVGLRPVQPDAG